MSSVVLGFESSPVSFALLRWWSEGERDPARVARRVLADAANCQETAHLPKSKRWWHRRDIVETDWPALLERHGVTGLRRMLGWFGLCEWVEADLDAYAMDREQFRQLVLAAALIGEALAIRTDQDPALGFLAGLFGSIGMVPMNALLGRVRPGMVFGGDPMAVSVRIQWERAQVRHDSLEVAAELLDRWRFADAVPSAIRTMAHPLLVTRGRPLTVLAFLAVRLAPTLALGDRSPAVDRTTRRCFESFVLSPGIIGELMLAAEEMLVPGKKLESEPVLSKSPV